MSHTISREKYALMYGPTVGDKVRLADTDLILEIEKDYTSYGDEIKFGGGKTLRDGMGQASEITRDGGGTGPADGTNATTCTPGPWNLREMLRAADAYPMNLGFLGKGNCSSLAPLVEQVKAGARGLKIHEDWGQHRRSSMPVCAFLMLMMCRRPSTPIRSMKPAA